jgi:hypothetical protein
MMLCDIKVAPLVSGELRADHLLLANWGNDIGIIQDSRRPSLSLSATPLIGHNNITKWKDIVKFVM